MQKKTPTLKHIKDNQYAIKQPMGHLRIQRRNKYLETKKKNVNSNPKSIGCSKTVLKESN